MSSLIEANILFDQHQYQQALVAFEALLAADPSNTEAMYGKGLSLHALGRVDKLSALADLMESLGSSRNITLRNLAQKSQCASM